MGIMDRNNKNGKSLTAILSQPTCGIPGAELIRPPVQGRQPEYPKAPQMPRSSAGLGDEWSLCFYQFPSPIPGYLLIFFSRFSSSYSPILVRPRLPLAILEPILLFAGHPVPRRVSLNVHLHYRCRIDTEIDLTARKAS